ncbi:MAG TPA: hypothetical protein VIV61_02825 [Candidatus Ozemobacteraceae bacterium]
MSAFPSGPGAMGARKARIGTTLIELILAFLILVIALLSVSGLISFGHRGTQKDFRMVQGIQLLEDTMNRFLVASCSQLLTSLPGTTPVTFTAPLLGIPLGPIRVGSTDYAVSATLVKQSVSFSTCELDITTSPPEYNRNSPATWRFSAATDRNGRFDGLALPHRVVKIHVVVGWTETLHNVQRRVEAVSFAVDFTP